MNILHPAWRFILALRAKGIDPHAEGLPQDGGCHTWNKTSKILSDIIAEDCGCDQTDSPAERQSQPGVVRFNLMSAYRFYSLKKQRAQVETYLLAGGDEAWLVSALQIKQGVLDAYKSAFFDLGVFRNGIDKMVYVDTINDYHERETKKNWIKGPEYMKWQMGYKVNTLDVKDALTSLLSDVYYRLKQSPDDTTSSLKLRDVAAKMGKELIGNKGADDLRRRLEEIITLDTQQHTYKTLEEFTNEQ